MLSLDLSHTQLRRDGALGSALPSFFTNSSTFANLTGELVPLPHTWLGPLLTRLYSCRLIGSAFTASSVLWNPIPSDLSMEWDGFSLLVDDVERYSGAASSSLRFLPRSAETRELEIEADWFLSPTRADYSLERLDLNPDLPHYFRLAVRHVSFRPFLYLLHS
jgi:hypothetical protein